MYDVMIDLETWDTKPTSAISQVAAVAFEPAYGGRVLNDRPLNCYVKLQHGSVSHDTLMFWLGEPAAARRLVSGMQDAVGVEQALADLATFPLQIEPGLTWEQVGRVWAWPSNFDLSILQQTYAAVGAETPWSHRQTRCARTYVEAAGWPEADGTGLVQHDAVDDCTYQIMRLQKAMGMIRT